MAVSLLSTIIIENVVAFAVLKIRKKYDIITVIFVNVMTNPIVVCFSFLSGYFGGMSLRIAVLIVLEVLAFFTEGLVYKKTLSDFRINPWIVSLILNAVSYTVGFAINKLVY